MGITEACKLRRERLMGKVHEDSILVSDPVHVYYLTGLKAALENLERPLMNTNPMFVGLSRNESMFLLAGRSSLVSPFWRDEFVFDAKHLFEGNLYTYEDYDPKERVSAPLDFVAEELSEVMTEMKSRRGFELESMGIEERHLQHEVTDRLSREFPSIRFSGISHILSELRKRKDADEVLSITEGTSRLRAALEHVGSSVVAGCTELDLLDDTRRWFREKYGDDAHLAGQVLSGSRTSEIMARASSKKIGTGEPVILDLQTRVDGNWARISHTIRFGRSEKREDNLVTELTGALRLGEAALVPGGKASEVFKIVSDAISKISGSSGLLHEAGHGIGLEAREAPFLLPSSGEVLEEGMVCVLTPGTYASSSGARTSGCYLVGKNGASRI